MKTLGSFSDVASQLLRSEPFSKPNVAKSQIRTRAFLRHLPALDGAAPERDLWVAHQVFQVGTSHTQLDLYREAATNIIHMHLMWVVLA